MSNVVLCKETAEEQVKDFARIWGVRDNKAILSMGKESSIPQEMTDILLVSIMTGDLEISADGKTLTQNLEAPIKEVEAITYRQQKIKKHHMADLQGLADEDQVLSLALLLSDVDTDDAFFRSEMTNRDMTLAVALATYISFT